MMTARTPLLLIVAMAALPAAPVAASGSYSSFPEPLIPPFGAPGPEEPRIKIDRAHFNLGRSIISGKHRPQPVVLSPDNIAEKQNRLTAVQKMLPKAVRRKRSLPALADQLGNREVNAVEYYVAVRYKKVIATPPSWAKEDPPPLIVYER